MVIMKEGGYNMIIWILSKIRQAIKKYLMKRYEIKLSPSENNSEVIVRQCNDPPNRTYSASGFPIEWFSNDDD